MKTKAGNDGSGNPLTEEFGAFVKNMLEKWKVPGMSLAVIDGEDVYAEVICQLFPRAL